MPAPVNIDAEHAIELTTFPFSLTQQVDDSGTTYTVWYKITPNAQLAASGNLLLWGYGGGGSYVAVLDTWIGPASSPTAYVISGAADVPCMIPILEGIEYFFSFSSQVGNPSPANLALAGDYAPNTNIPAGSIFIPDDVTDFYAVFTSDSTDYDVLGARSQILACELGDSNTDGCVLTNDNASFDHLCYYDADFNLTYIAVSADLYTIRLCWGTQNFCVGRSGGGLIHAGFYKVTGAGVLSTIAADIGVVGCTAAAFSNDESLVYTGGQSTSLNQPIKVWDVVGAAFTTDLHAAITGYSSGSIIVLDNDNIVVIWTKSTATRNIRIKVIQPDGTVLQTLNLTNSDHYVGSVRAVQGNTGNDFWLWVTFDTDPSRQHFYNFDDSLNQLDDVQAVSFLGGVSEEAASATPTSLVGISISCPLMIQRFALDSVPFDITPGGIYIYTDELEGISDIRRNDEYFTSDSLTQETAIPDPFATIYPAGD